MATQHDPVVSPELTRRVTLRALRRQAFFLVATLTAVATTSLLLAMLAAGLQARRDEARNADLAVVIAPALPPAELLERSFDLYRRGFAPRMMLAGAGAERLRTALLEQGVAEDAVEIVADDGGAVVQLRTALEQARVAGAASVVVVSEGAGLLRWLKLAGDAGLNAYGAPAPADTPGPLELLQAGGQYWRYVLFAL